MPLNMNDVAKAEQKRTEYQPIPAKAHAGRLVGVVDMGLQPRAPYQGKPKKPAYRVRLTFELPNQRIEVDGESRPRWIDKEITFSTYDNSTCVKFFKTMDPDGVTKGDWTKLIGTPVQVVVVHNKGDDGRIYDNIQDIVPLMDGIEVGDLENDPLIFDLSNPDMETFDRLPKFKQDKIKANLEFKGSKLETLLSGNDLPVTASTPEIDKDVQDQAANESADEDAAW